MNFSSIDWIIVVAYLAGAGFHADIQQLRTHHPEIGWHSLRHWAAEHDWAAPAP